MPPLAYSDPEPRPFVATLDGTGDSLHGRHARGSRRNSSGKENRGRAGDVRPDHLVTRIVCALGPVRAGWSQVWPDNRQSAFHRQGTT
jgi:hypothetical protein